MMWTGTWRRPHSYGDPAGEARNVHETLGVIDVSTLGKLLVSGPDSAEFLERLYPNRFGDMKPGRIRYGVLNSDAGRIMDDGTIARLSEEDFYVTTTSTGAGAVRRVVRVVERDLAARRRDRRRHRLGRGGQRRRAERPRADDAAHRPRRLERGASRTSTPSTRRSPASRRCSCASASSARSATSSTSRARTASTSGTRSSSAAPTSASGRSGWSRSGSSAWRRCTSSSARTRTPSRTSSRRRCPGSPSSTRTTSSASGRSSTCSSAGFREQLVGFETESGVVPLEGGQIVIDGKPGGRVTSARWSDHLGRAIGMAWVPPDLAEEDAELTIKVDGSAARRRACACGRSSTRTGRSCARERTSTSSAPTSPPRTPRWASPLERALAHAPAGIEDLSRTGVLEVRGELDGLDAGERRGRAADAGARARALPLRGGRPAARRGSPARAAWSSTSRPAGRGCGVRGRDAACAASPTSTSTRSRPSGSSPTCAALVVRRRRRRFRLYFPQEYADSVAEVVLDAAKGARHEGRLPRPAHVAPAVGAEGPLRRRHRRRRLARPRHGVLPGQEPRHHRRGRPREELHRLRRRRAATRPSSARTTARPRAPSSTRRASSSTRASSADLDFNLLFSQQGHLTLAHSDRGDHHRQPSAPR